MAAKHPSLVPLLLELERMYDALAPLFGAPLDPRPVIVVQSGGRRKNILGWHQQGVWRNGAPDTDALSELTIVAEALTRPPEEVVETLVHEMVHHCNAVQKVRDCSSNQYHNKKFKELAERVGLQVADKDEKRGYAFTSLSPELRERIEGLKLDPEAFALARRVFDPTLKKPTKMKKWTCGCTIVRCATGLVASCSKCGNDFDMEE